MRMLPYPSRRNWRIRLSQVVALAIVSTIGLSLLAVVAIVASQRSPTPPPTLADLDAAEERWRLHGPASYDLDVTTSRQDRIHLEVRDGKPTACTLNGVPPKQKRVWETWAVPRQFQYIRDDMERPVRERKSRPLIKVEFDKQTGLPWKYLHAAEGGLSTGWKIDRFEAVDR